MNDLFFIEYKPELMLSDSIDMSGPTELAHRRLCDFIWRLDRAPKYDPSWLINFTKCAESQWPAVESGLIEKGWSIKGGYFLHGGAIDTHNKAKRRYMRTCNQTAPAISAKTGEPVKVFSCKLDEITGLLSIVESSNETIVVANNVTTDVAKGNTTVVTSDVTGGKSKSKSKSKLEPPETAITSQTSQSSRWAHGTKLTFSMLSRIATEIRENKHGWHYDNHKLSPDSLVPAGLVATLRPYVDRVTDVQVREAWAEAALKTHQAAVDGMKITHSLAHYAVGIWREELEKVAVKVSD